MSTAAVDGLQQALAAEHAALYVFGALGGRASALPEPALHAALTLAYDAHLQRRDVLRTLVSGAGATPVAAEPAYLLPSPLDTRRQIVAEALSVEQRCVTTYAALVAVTTGQQRRFAVDALTATALDEATFGGSPQALPGMS